MMINEVNNKIKRESAKEERNKNNKIIIIQTTTQTKIIIIKQHKIESNIKTEHYCYTIKPSLLLFQYSFRTIFFTQAAFLLVDILDTGQYH